MVPEDNDSVDEIPIEDTSAKIGFEANRMQHSYPAPPSPPNVEAPMGQVDAPGFSWGWVVGAVVLAAIAIVILILVIG